MKTQKNLGFISRFEPFEPRVIPLIHRVINIFIEKYE